ncbi:carbonic anhydrase [Saccharibacillus sp. CPCC 101409]|uniref:beta-class carbonic anhydrase n=1 Tax=Saccharibacillus sp. CPCC 101409 TaxID=3058041 RepID=UPI002673065D|nr:carbonic anhydrase [Saccharibacillus sp. CPCC 101409]MDO3411848.1 carbonic anhydrase [Saccharibacillus sp. CPCC 101409]
MSQINEILEHNQAFVENKEYETFISGKFPEKKVVVLTCMDTRLTELLPRAMNLRNGDAKILKTAGAVISSPFGSIMRSILVALYELQAEEVIVVGHYECGMASLNAEHIMGKMRDRGVTEEVLTTLDHSGVNLAQWFKGVENETQGVMHSVNMISKHPLMPPGVPVHGMLIDPKTGQLELVSDGYERLKGHETDSPASV